MALLTFYFQSFKPFLCYLLYFSSSFIPFLRRSISSSSSSYSLFLFALASYSYNYSFPSESAFLHNFGFQYLKLFFFALSFVYLSSLVVPASFLPSNQAPSASFVSSNSFVVPFLKPLLFLLPSIFLLSSPHLTQPAFLINLQPNIVSLLSLTTPSPSYSLNPPFLSFLPSFHLPSFFFVSSSSPRARFPYFFKTKPSLLTFPRLLGLSYHDGNHVASKTDSSSDQSINIHFSPFFVSLPSFFLSI